MVLCRHKRQILCNFIDIELSNMNADIKVGKNSECSFTDGCREEHVSVSDDAFYRH